MRCNKCGIEMIRTNLKETRTPGWSCPICDAPNQVSSEKVEQQMIETINHPAHYETGKFECISVMEEVFGQNAVKDFCLLNAFKYLYRCRSKHDSPVEDCEKSVWYINKFLEMEKGEEK